MEDEDDMEDGEVSVEEADGVMDGDAVEAVEDRWEVGEVAEKDGTGDVAERDGVEANSVSADVKAGDMVLAGETEEEEEEEVIAPSDVAVSEGVAAVDDDFIVVGCTKSERHRWYGRRGGM
jgi:hypothetical protein